MRHLALDAYLGRWHWLMWILAALIAVWLLFFASPTVSQSHAEDEYWSPAQSHSRGASAFNPEPNIDYYGQLDKAREEERAREYRTQPMPPLNNADNNLGWKPNAPFSVYQDGKLSTCQEGFNKSIHCWSH